jgi:hypothetical protein
LRHCVQHSSVVEVAEGNFPSAPASKVRFYLFKSAPLLVGKGASDERPKGAISVERPMGTEPGNGCYTHLKGIFFILSSLS